MTNHHTNHISCHNHSNKDTSKLNNLHNNHDSCHNDNSINVYKIKFIITLLLTVPILFLSDMIQLWFGYKIDFVYKDLLIILLSTVVYIYGGGIFIKGMFQEIKNFRPGMMTLIGVAITVAYIYSVISILFFDGKEFFWELSTLITIMLLGHWIESKSILSVSNVVEELLKILPKKVHLLYNIELNKYRDISIDQLKVGDIILVKKGEKVPLDGIILKGNTYIDESFLTGEYKPIFKKEGDEVIGGSINVGDNIIVKIIRVGEDLYISKILKLVQDIQSNKLKVQDLANKLSGFLFYFSLTVGIITYIYWYINGYPSQAIERLVTVLVIACPHALGLAIPLVLYMSNYVISKKGILVRNKKVFEYIKDIDIIVFDKTGTLTEGNFKVIDFVNLSGYDDNLIHNLVYNIELNSEHLIGSKIVEFIKNNLKNNLKELKVKKFKIYTGLGVYAEIEDNNIWIGGSSLLKYLNIKENNIEDNDIYTIIYIIINGKLVGYYKLFDQIRPDSYEVVNILKKMGYKVYMLTGDDYKVAEYISIKLGLDGFFSNLLPDDKVNKIREFKNNNSKVLMVGDGINDGPSLLEADVGIAIGSGTDLAIKSADIILVNNDLLSIPKFIKFSKYIYRKIIQNLFWAVGYNVVAIPLAAGLLYKYGIIITPSLGAIFMSLSTVIVAINAQFIKKYKF